MIETTWRFWLIFSLIAASVYSRKRTNWKACVIWKYLCLSRDSHIMEGPEALWEQLNWTLILTLNSVTTSWKKTYPRQWVGLQKDLVRIWPVFYTVLSLKQIEVVLLLFSVKCNRILVRSDRSFDVSCMFTVHWIYLMSEAHPVGLFRIHGAHRDLEHYIVGEVRALKQQHIKI